LDDFVVRIARSVAQCSLLIHANRVRCIAFSAESALSTGNVIERIRIRGAIMRLAPQSIKGFTGVNSKYGAKIKIAPQSTCRLIDELISHITDMSLSGAKT
jgi:hypothetical protein